eukprot:COSAG02_NODE_116_length_35392_cov_302.150001_14_plen_159_part_00
MHARARVVVTPGIRPFGGCGDRCGGSTIWLYCERSTRCFCIRRRGRARAPTTRARGGGNGCAHACAGAELSNFTTPFVRSRESARVMRSGACAKTQSLSFGETISSTVRTVAAGGCTGTADQCFRLPEGRARAVVVASARRRAVSWPCGVAKGHLASR